MALDLWGSKARVWVIASPRFEALPLINFNFFSSGDELFSDTYKIVLKDECLYEVWGKVRTKFYSRAAPLKSV